MFIMQSVALINAYTAYRLVSLMAEHVTLASQSC